ncbi:uncharacterized protein B0I36DRAFT_34196 [Microdochium trichocladiopsis]|uniref:Uncharacterized protein n=1 Tax=Microdochium trichocladiopsis TaxID=1682393 RepID=A0A9P8XWV7_9PEZI|nr:uncharacterized protein B0I36DRAFT_34196 [Microdochium trichocladiopsis]KAH7021634.1 hypothetical protein B0I36DRAFT_34196 [Microdochium trichocladiopsis]
MDDLNDAGAELWDNNGLTDIASLASDESSINATIAETDDRFMPFHDGWSAQKDEHSAPSPLPFAYTTAQSIIEGFVRIENHLHSTHDTLEPMAESSQLEAPTLARHVQSCHDSSNDHGHEPTDSTSGTIFSLSNNFLSKNDNSGSGGDELSGHPSSNLDGTTQSASATFTDFDFDEPALSPQLSDKDLHDRFNNTFGSWEILRDALVKFADKVPASVVLDDEQYRGIIQLTGLFWRDAVELLSICSHPNASRRTRQLIEENKVVPTLWAVGAAPFLQRFTSDDASNPEHMWTFVLQWVLQLHHLHRNVPEYKHLFARYVGLFAILAMVASPLEADKCRWALTAQFWYRRIAGLA